LKILNKNLNDETKYICEDNACHLFGVNDELKDKTFFIDRFYIKNHNQTKFESSKNSKYSKYLG
jgi:hypothetical protein